MCCYNYCVVLKNYIFSKDDVEGRGKCTYVTILQMSISDGTSVVYMYPSQKNDFYIFKSFVALLVLSSTCKIIII